MKDLIIFGIEPYQMKDMLKNKKALIITGVVILVILLLSVALIFQNKRAMKKNQNTHIIDMNNNANVELTSDNKKKNISEKVNASRNLEGIEISNIELYATADISYFKANVKNTKETNFSGGVAVITFKNKAGEETDILEIYIPALDAQKENTINASTTSDIANAYDFDIKLS